MYGNALYTHLAVIVVSFDPVVYMVREDVGSVTLNITAEGMSIIPLTVVISTSTANATAQGTYVRKVGVGNELCTYTIHSPSKLYKANDNIIIMI